MEQSVYSNKKAGFTLIEFCVATLIMMVGLLGLLQGVNLAIEQNLGTLIRNEAVSVADEQMVFAKSAAATSTGFDAMVTLSSPDTVSRKIRGGGFTFKIYRDVTVKSPKSKEVRILVDGITGRKH